MKYDFSILDVFISDEGRFSGNQLAVVPEASGLAPGAMQETAREFHFSETVFMTGREKGAFRARIFTPEEEVPFAGHPTLGLAYYIRERVLRAPVPVALELPAGRILVFEDESDPGLLWMRQREPVFGRGFAPEKAAAALSLGKGEIDPERPAAEISTGLPFCLVPLRNPDAVRRASPDRAAIRELFSGGPALGLFFFAPLSENRFLSRMFAPHLGVEEDPATGSATGCLAAYLSKTRYLGSDSVNAVSEQGASVKRPSILRLRADPREGVYNVSVGGRSRIVADGQIDIA